MKRIPHRKITLLLCLSLSALPALNIAQPITPGSGSGQDSNTLNRIRQAVEYLAKQLKPTLEVMQSQDYEPVFDAGTTLATNLSAINMMQSIKESLGKGLATSTGWLLSNNEPISIRYETGNPLTSGSDTNPFYVALAQYMMSIPAADFPPQGNKQAVNYSINFGGASTANQTIAEGNKNMDASSLLGKTYYTFGAKNGGDLKYTLDNLPRNKYQFPLPQDHAMNYIMYLSGLAQLFGTPDYSVILKSLGSTPKDIMNNQTLRAYLLTERAYSSLVSLGLNNLYHSYFERVPVKNLAKKSGMPNNKAINPIYPNASPLQVDQYMATRRLDPKWFNEMSKASPATVQRQMLFLLVEMRYEAYQQRLETERTNAALSALLLMNANIMRGGVTLEDLKNSLAGIGDNNNNNSQEQKINDQLNQQIDNSQSQGQ